MSKVDNESLRVTWLKKIEIQGSKPTTYEWRRKANEWTNSLNAREDSEAIIHAVA